MNSQKKITYANVEEMHSKKIEKMSKRKAMTSEDIEYLLDVMPIIEEYSNVQKRSHESEEETQDLEDAGEAVETGRANETGRTKQTGKKRSKTSTAIDAYASIKPGSNAGTLCLRYLEATVDKTSHEFMNIRNKLAETASKEEREEGIECSKCGAAYVVVQTECDLVCPECGEAKTYIDFKAGMTYEQEVNNSNLPQFAYKRINHLTEALSQLQAKQSTNIPDEVLNAVKAEFKKARFTSVSDITAPKVRAFLKKLGYTKYYEHTSYIAKLMGVEPPQIDEGLENKLKQMFLAIQGPFANHCPPERSNFVSYSYVLHKLCQLLDRDDLSKHFPLLKSRQKLQAHDALWKLICKDLRWEFIKSV